ncbi:hypothetical protein FA15DRAFT_48872 [Coprinopsis marcescibilis]|uniref:Uncharacterized protein n=1 Tax=Coprinopsis marcescibilis TaxID=230819 RepID=A0A5C3KNS3_COPMA|nr:hypothetical protein FA15DRAFT_48872 [Coprinopsis marcescibilis]
MPIMSPIDDFTTPASTELTQAQVFKLKTSRPSSHPEGQPFSPVPVAEQKRPTVTRKYTRRKTRRVASSKNLKENATSGHVRRSSGTSKDALTGKSANGSLLWKSAKKIKLPKSNSVASLASPFNSRPASPSLSCYSSSSGESLVNPKRTLADASDDFNLPASKRRNSGINASTLSLPNDQLLPSPIAMGIRTPEDPHLVTKKAHISTQSPDPSFSAKAMRSKSRKSLRRLSRRPSHPALGLEHPTLSRRAAQFDPKSSLGLIDFDRPPSQLSVYGYCDQEAEEGSAIYNVDKDIAAHELFIAGLQGGRESTPFKIQGLDTIPIESSFGVENMHSPVTNSGSVLKKLSSKDHSRLYELTESMSLTSAEDGLHFHNDLGGRSPWITDSLISPPTIYLTKEAASLDLFTSQLGKATPKDVVDPISPPQDDESLVSCRSVHESPCPVTSTQQTSVNAGNNVTRTRSGTITLATASTNLPGRTRSGTITQANHTSTVTVNAPAGSARARSGTIVSQRTRSNTIRPAVTTTTSTGAVIGLQTREESAARAETQPELEVVYADAEFDPAPDEMLVFSSAPNPDVEEDNDDDLTLPTGIARSLSEPRSSEADPLNLGLSNRTSAQPEDSRPVFRVNSRWTTKKDSNKKRSISASKGLKLKRVLGLAKGDTGSSSTSSATFADGGPSSPDPLDFFNAYDDEECAAPAQNLSRTLDKPKDHETGNKQNIKASKRKSLSIRWEGMVGSAISG